MNIVQQRPIVFGLGALVGVEYYPNGSKAFEGIPCRLHPRKHAIELLGAFRRLGFEIAVIGDGTNDFTRWCVAQTALPVPVTRIAGMDLGNSGPTQEARDICHALSAAGRKCRNHPLLLDCSRHSDKRHVFATRPAGHKLDLLGSPLDSYINIGPAPLHPQDTPDVDPALNRFLAGKARLFSTLELQESPTTVRRDPICSSPSLNGPQ